MFLGGIVIHVRLLVLKEEVFMSNLTGFEAENSLEYIGKIFFSYS